MNHDQSPETGTTRIHKEDSNLMTAIVRNRLYRSHIAYQVPFTSPTIASSLTYLLFTRVFDLVPRCLVTCAHGFPGYVRHGEKFHLHAIV
jgi:hypothetical protein